MKKVREPTYSFVLLTLGLIVIDTILARLSVVALPAGVSGASVIGVSVIYVAVAFMILFTLWFGAYGAIAAYAGTLLGSGLLSSMPPGVAVYWSVAGLLQVLIPLVAFRAFEVDLALENRRDWTILILFGVLINNIIGAAWGTITLALGVGIPSGQIVNVLFMWFLGNVIVTLLIVPIALRRLSPTIVKSKLFVKYYWD